MRILHVIGSFLYAIRWLIVGVLAIALPIYLFLIFAKERVFGPKEDVELGKMSAQSLAEDLKEYPILPESEYPEAYAHLRRIVGRVMGSPKIQYRDVFAHVQMKIMNRDDVGIPEILNDHPDSGSRMREAQRLGCSTKPADPSRWRAFEDSLPAHEAAAQPPAKQR